MFPQGFSVILSNGNLTRDISENSTSILHNGQCLRGTLVRQEAHQELGREKVQVFVFETSSFLFVFFDGPSLLNTLSTNDPGWFNSSVISRSVVSN